MTFSSETRGAAQTVERVVSFACVGVLLLCFMCLSSCLSSQQEALWGRKTFFHISAGEAAPVVFSNQTPLGRRWLTQR